MDIGSDRILYLENKKMKCTYCDVEREKRYDGGGLWIEECPACHSRTETNYEIE
jgi:hypothetical protein